MNDYKLLIESIIHFSGHSLDDPNPQNDAYYSVFKSRITELNEFIEKNPILLQTLTDEQKIFLHRNIENLREKSEDSEATKAMQKVSSYILHVLKKASSGNSKPSSFQIFSDPKSLEAIIQVTLEKNTAHLPQLAEVLLNMPFALSLLDPTLANQFILTLAEIKPDLAIRNIQKFQIIDPEIHEKIAEILLQKSPGWLCAYIQDLYLSRTTLEKIAREAADKTPSAFISHIEKFGIENSVLIEEIATNIAQTEPSLLAENIQKFHIQNEEVRRSLAVSISEVSPGLLAYNIRNFELSSDSDIEEIFSQLANLDPGNFD